MTGTMASAMRRAFAVAAGAAAAIQPGAGRAQQAAPPQSLVADPQQGATPRPLDPSPSLPAPPPSQPVALPPAPATDLASPPPVFVPRGAIPGTTPAVPPPARTPRLDQWARGIPGGLPAPTGDPLHIDPATDPVLQLGRAQSSTPAFQKAIGEAVARNPALDEATAQVDEAAAARAEARARTLPVADLSATTYHIISRSFGNDTLDQLEAARPQHRTDTLLAIQQPVFDFGAGLNRIRAGRERLAAARARVDDTGSQVALRAISAWYDVYGYRALVRLGEAFAKSQRTLRASVQDRVDQGAAAPAEFAQVDSYIAASDARLADFRRQLANAEAQYTAVIGSPAPADLGRAPVPSIAGIGAATLAGDTARLPAVQSARLLATAARSDVRATKADRLPRVTASLDAGRYGIIETARDYDVRGNLSLTWRLGGGAAQRVGQAEARAEGADARMRRTQIEAQRDAQIALSDVQALEEAKAAIESNYLTSRQSRDVLAERFRVARGTLFDLLGADVNYFGVATRYIQTVIELDIARYALLSRTGRLLPALGIKSSMGESQ